MVVVIDTDLQEALVAPWATQGIPSLKPLSVGYYKGRTRVTVLLTILSLLRDNYGPLEEAVLEFRVVQLSNLFCMAAWHSSFRFVSARFTRSCWSLSRR
jgi:hypothetical protein